MMRQARLKASASKPRPYLQNCPTHTRPIPAPLRSTNPAFRSDWLGLMRNLAAGYTHATIASGKCIGRTAQQCSRQTPPTLLPSWSHRQGRRTCKAEEEKEGEGSNKMGVLFQQLA